MRFKITSEGLFVAGIPVPVGAIIDTQNGIDNFSVAFRVSAKQKSLVNLNYINLRIRFTCPGDEAGDPPRPVVSSLVAEAAGEFRRYSLAACLFVLGDVTGFFFAVCVWGVICPRSISISAPPRK